MSNCLRSTVLRDCGSIAPEHSQIGRNKALETHDALNRFLASAEKRAYRMAQLATGSPDDALDIVQDAMLKLVQKYSDKPEEDWGALLHRIVQSRITDWYRRQSVRNRIISWIGIDETEGNTAANRQAPSPEHVLHNEQAIDSLQQAIQQLPLRQRQTFLLRCWEGLDVQQTARAMQCSAGSVKTHYHRALNSLRGQLGDNWP